MKILINLENLMAIFKDADQERVALKMKLSNFAWYGSSSVVSCEDGYYILILVKKINNYVKKHIPPLINGVVVKMALE